MRHLDLTLPSPAENLACDEALLDWREQNGGEEILRFWESPEPFVVAGYANKIATEVNVANCEVKKIPILRRCSGGGTVLQGRGCLNYALILRIAKNSPLAGISSANKFIMERNREAIESEVRSQKPEARILISGHTDLTLNPQLSTLNKFSGNSQRRHKHFLLFHGTFLLNFDLALVSEFLRMPSKQPDYRKERSHGEFLTNLNLSADKVKAALQKIWKADLPLENPP
ncbi:MAG TPA: lipoate--protein ligase family protein, partial [Candidatus Baltobacteraceae bacterium]|nr:lipoate--protein ligase family protein [Candidatus Baltobacteraceae bacterium]